MRLEPGLWRVGHATRQSSDGSSSADVLLETRRAPLGQRDVRLASKGFAIRCS